MKGTWHFIRVTKSLLPLSNYRVRELVIKVMSTEEINGVWSTSVCVCVCVQREVRRLTGGIGKAPKTAVLYTLHCHCVLLPHHEVMGCSSWKCLLVFFLYKSNILTHKAVMPQMHLFTAFPLSSHSHVNHRISRKLIKITWLKTGWHLDNWRVFRSDLVLRVQRPLRGTGRTQTWWR